MAIDPSSVGASQRPAHGELGGSEELSFTTENSHETLQHVLPTFAVIACSKVSALGRAGDLDRGRLVHGSQSVRLLRPLPPAGELSVTSEILDIQDKGEGKNAIITLVARATNPATDELVAECTSSLVHRGGGGFGGVPGQRPPRVVYPQRALDLWTQEATREDQALIYRLSEDRNPLHSDPWFARHRAGFPGPILQGLCTYGFAGRALLRGFCDSQPGRFRAMSARFSSPAFPGEILSTEGWELGTGSAAFRTEASSPDGANARVVLDDGLLEFVA